MLKKEIRKEMKIKEGAEKLREVSTDKKSLSNVSSIVKKANTKLQQLHQELQDLNACLLVTNTSSQDIGTGRSCCCISNCRVSVACVLVMNTSSQDVGTGRGCCCTWNCRISVPVSLLRI